MNKTGLYVFYLSLIILFLNACASDPKRSLALKNKNIELNAVLTDPIIKRDFRSLKTIAANAPIQNNFNETTIKKLDEASFILIDRLQNHYHLNVNKYKIHTFIGLNKPQSCYQYYDSTYTHTIGKTCHESSSQFGSCTVCENFVNIVRSRTMRVIHANTRNNRDTIALIDTFRLRNGDFVYLALELSPSA